MKEEKEKEHSTAQVIMAFVQFGVAIAGLIFGLYYFLK